MEMQENKKSIFNFFKKIEIEDNTKKNKYENTIFFGIFAITIMTVALLGVINSEIKSHQAIDVKNITLLKRKADIELIEKIDDSKFNKILNFIDTQEKLQLNTMNKAYWEVKYIKDKKITVQDQPELNYQEENIKIQQIKVELHEHFMERKFLMHHVYDLVKNGQNIELPNTGDGKNPYDIFIEWIELEKIGHVVNQPMVSEYLQNLQPYLSNQTEVIDYFDKHKSEMEKTAQFNDFT